MTRDVIIENTGEVVRARLPRDIDHHFAKAMREKIDGALAEFMPKRLILDFSDVAFMDSSGVGLVIGRVESAKRYGTTVELTGAADGIMRLLRICGIERIEDLYITH